MDGLGLLDVTTTLMPVKVTLQRQVRVVGGGAVIGYEIHHGVTQAGPHARPHLEDELGWQQGNVWGVYLHGILENTAYREQFLARLGWQGQTQDWPHFLDAQIDHVADSIRETGWAAHLQMRH
jgi:adenosylcobyric acid synthase